MKYRILAVDDDPAAETIFGTKAAHVVGQTFEHLIIPGKPTELEIIIGDGQTIIAEMRVMETDKQKDITLIEQKNSISHYS